MKKPLAMILEPVRTILKGYASILFLESPWSGLLLLAATFWYPHIGLSGLTSVGVSYITAVVLRFPQAKSEIYVYNSTLVGLSLGAFFPLNEFLAVMLFFSAVLATLVTVAVKNVMYRLDNLPPLSLPFLIVASLSTTAAYSLPGAHPALQFNTQLPPLLSPLVDTFLSTLGAVYFTPHPLAGLLIFAALLFASRYLAILAIVGYAAGVFGFRILAIPLSNELLVWTGFNFILTTMALGGIFTVPGRASLVFATLAAVLTAPLILVAQKIVLTYQIPIMVLPFVVITTSLLLVLKNRQTMAPPNLTDQPGIPEHNFERARLAAVRNGRMDSISVLPPFFGEWTVYQGMEGRHTHKKPWQHALDFYVLKQNRSYQNSGRAVEDYHCYNLPVVSPVHGSVARILDKLPDNTPGDVDLGNNWGNFILIRLDSGLHLLLAHLKQNSIKVAENDRVKPGSLLARCGNSGRSPQPHLHMHIQTDARLGSATYPFHLSSVITATVEQDHLYRLTCVPQTGDSVLAIEQNTPLALDLHLPVGRTLTYEIRNERGDDMGEVEFYVELSLQNQYRFVSSGGGSSAFEEINGVLGFYDRRGGKDRILDMWLLANGLTPLSDKANSWQDQPSGLLLPLAPWQRLAVQLWYPLGTGINSSYQRVWDGDAGHWRQTGVHRLHFGMFGYTVQSESILVPEVGFSNFSLTWGKRSLHASLKQKGLREDEGIPGWSLYVNRQPPAPDPEQEARMRSRHG